eukprot:209321-Chlamydomonas_euryale.AAC.3
MAERVLCAPDPTGRQPRPTRIAHLQEPQRRRPPPRLPGPCCDHHGSTCMARGQIQDGAGQRTHEGRGWACQHVPDIHVADKLQPTLFKAPAG